ncbi:hypothetical protein BGZ76_008196 [Entomortierella beljakovae]|nr:hypothetical protein BGZ76_008196 [Entomortierella beljakovae]
MWICYNYDTITSLSMDTSKAHRFIPYAAKLVNLQTIHLSREITLLDRDLEDTLTFITLHQSMFPMKEPLHFEFAQGWDHKLSDEGMFEQTMDLELYIARRREFRDWNLQYMRPMVEIIEAVKKPDVLQVHNVPRFYNLAENIDTGRLVELHDSDQDRYDVGEREAMEAFLRRSVNIRTLRLGVSHHDAFSWTVQKKSAELCEPLMKVVDLEISSDQVYHAAIRAFNDAMMAFASSLRTVKLRHVIDYREHKLPYVSRNLMTLRSLQLQRIPLANVVGVFPSMLPNLTSLKIILDHALSINVGDFSTCPNLEEFELEFGYDDNSERRPDGEEPTELPLDGQIINADWRQAKIDYTLFPIWNMPKLKSLKLEKMAAMRFDFASLPSMQNLEKFHIRAGPKSTYPQYIYDYLIRQHKIPLDSQPTTTTTTTTTTTGTTTTSTASTTPVEINNTLDKPFGIFGSYSYKKWTLPKLTFMYMVGPPSATFCLEYLRLFPKLEKLLLFDPGYPVEFYRNPMTVDASSKYDTPSLQGYDPTAEMFDNTPLMESQLTEIILTNTWIMTGADLFSLLTTYAPHLEKLTVTLLQKDGDNGYRFLEVFNDVDNNNNVFGIEDGSTGSSSGSTVSQQDSDGNMSMSRMLPGQRLAYVKCRYTIRDRELKELGYKMIELHERVLYKKKGFRIYEIWEVLYVRQRDFEQIENEKKLQAKETDGEVE